MGVLYGVGVTFDQLFHLPQVSLLDFLELLLTPANPGENENRPNDPVGPESGKSNPRLMPRVLPLNVTTGDK